LNRHSVPFVRFSEVDSNRDSGPLVTLVDSIGLLRDIWGLADIGFVGGSLAPHGGQNLVEPASYGVPILIGPNTWNFQSVVDDYLSANAIVQVDSAKSLLQAIQHWLKNPVEATQTGERARQLTGRHSTAVELTVAGIASLLKSPHNPI